MTAPSIAACLIVKDAAETIEDCLASLRPHVDEIDVYDTGSTDDTLAVLARLAEQPGDGLAHLRVERGEWRDDFSWARERSFELASPETGWFVWADADDVVVGGAALRGLARSAEEDVDGFMCAYDLPLLEGGVRSRAWRERLVRADRGFRWSGRIHETLVLPDRQPRMRGVDPDLVRWVHAQPPDRGNLGRNLDFLHADEAQAAAAGEAVHPHTLMYLGVESILAGALDAAVPYLREYIARTGDSWADDRLYVTNHLAGCLRVLGDRDGALELELEAWAARPDWPLTAAGIAATYAARRDWEQVLLWAQRALDGRMPWTPAAIPVTKLRVLPALLVAEAKLALGDGEGAVAAFAAAAEREPADEELPGLAAAFAARVAEGDPAGAGVVVRAAEARVDDHLHALLRGLRLAGGAR